MIIIRPTPVIMRRSIRFNFNFRFAQNEKSMANFYGESKKERPLFFCRAYFVALTGWQADHIQLQAIRLQFSGRFVRLGTAHTHRPSNKRQTNYNWHFFEFFISSSFRSWYPRELTCRQLQGPCPGNVSWIEIAEQAQNKQIVNWIKDFAAKLILWRWRRLLAISTDTCAWDGKLIRRMIVVIKLESKWYIWLVASLPIHSSDDD